MYVGSINSSMVWGMHLMWFWGKPYQYTCDILNTFEDADGIVWDDNIWDDILNSDKDPDEIWDEINKLIAK